MVVSLDYKTLMEIVPTSQPLYRDTSSMLRGIGPRIEAARKRDTDKMLGQLKEVGNSMLGTIPLLPLSSCHAYIH